MRRGDVYWFIKRMDKRRPVLLLTRDEVIPHLHEVTVASITSQTRPVPSQVVIGPEDGMPKICAVNLHHLRTINKRDIGSKITELDQGRMEQVRKALLFALGFRP